MSARDAEETPVIFARTGLSWTMRVVRALILERVCGGQGDKKRDMGYACRNTR